MSEKLQSVFVTCLRNKTASGAKSAGGSGSRQVHGEGNTTIAEQRELQGFNGMRISEPRPQGDNVAGGPNSYPLHSIPMNIIEFLHFSYALSLIFNMICWEIILIG